ncbi:MAG: flagellar hook-associated protein FlgL [Candidatus Acidiferrales bacterium]|jgi:flagellar hook-associated protein 3 FlgL
MSTRINPNILPDMLAAMEAAQQNAQNASQEVSTGKSVNNPGDNPAAVAALVINDAQTSQDAQFQTNIGDLQSKFQVADSVLNSASQVLTSAISLGTQGATGTLTTADRQSIAAQVAGLQQQMLSLANTSYQGAYIFAGTDVTTQPFTQNSSAPSGVTYSGNSAVTNVEISQGQSIQTNLPGDQVFANSAGNAFAALHDLTNALNSGTGIAAANTEVQNAFNQLNNQRVFYGNSLSQLQSTESFLSQDTVNLSQQQNTLIGANLTQAISDLSQSQTAEQASLSATAQILNLPNLLQYIK